MTSRRLLIILARTGFAAREVTVIAAPKTDYHTPQAMIGPAAKEQPRLFGVWATCVGLIARRIPRRGDFESAPVISAPASSWAKYAAEHKVDIGPTPGLMGRKNWRRDVRRRGCRTSTSFAILAISNNPITLKLSRGGLRIGMGPKRGPKAFLRPYLTETSGLSELARPALSPGSQGPR